MPRSVRTPSVLIAVAVGAGVIDYRNPFFIAGVVIVVTIALLRSDTRAASSALSIRSYCLGRQIDRSAQPIRSTVGYTLPRRGVVKTTMQPQIDHAAAAKRESRLLIGVAAGLGCFLLLCLAITSMAVLLALIWTLQGQLGPGSSLVPTGLQPVVRFA